MEGELLKQLQEAGFQVLQVLIYVVVTAAGLLGTWLIYRIKKFVDAKTDGETKVLAMKALEQFDKLIKDSVREYEQSVRPGINDGGKLTKIQMIQARNKVAGRVLGQLPDVTKNLISTIVNDLNVHMATQIEKTMFDINRERDCLPTALLSEPIVGQIGETKLCLCSSDKWVPVDADLPK